MTESWLSVAKYMDQHQFAHTWNRNLISRVAQAAIKIMAESGQEPIVETYPVKGAKKGITRDVATYPKSVLDQAFNEQRYL